MSIHFTLGTQKSTEFLKLLETVIAALSKTIHKWDKKLPLPTLVNRMAVHEVTDFPPSFVLTRRGVSLPLDVILGTTSLEDKVMASEYMNRFLTQLQMCFTEVWNSLKKFGEWQPKLYNLLSHGEQNESGDIVYLWKKTGKKQVSLKLMPKRKGPKWLSSTLEQFTKSW